ncbi:hypothetical protein PVAP13_3KG318300 [Panicum virgatum]|uniref:Uncharacterized protein n=1 Tax=Panicum virgatum TaxID=38727 RepID=A0A8T0UZA5_PANVG|nr:hypothetical protein PVAP13_3KG318300 [Panicum virgatum]KAG2626034.1 hypothetical protein PVAP13_3KG318300 [Panicum virgatum]
MMRVPLHRSPSPVGRQGRRPGILGRSHLLAHPRGSRARGWKSCNPRPRRGRPTRRGSPATLGPARWVVVDRRVDGWVVAPSFSPVVVTARYNARLGDLPRRAASAGASASHLMLVICPAAAPQQVRATTPIPISSRALTMGFSPATA